MITAAGHQLLYLPPYSPELNPIEHIWDELREKGLTLTEIAPGIDLHTQVLAQLGFMPLIANPLKEMDARIFQAGPMGIFHETIKNKK